MIRIRCWLNQERQGHGRFVNVDVSNSTVKELCVMISDRFEVGDGGHGSLFADEGEILVEDVAILRDGDRVSYVPSNNGAPMIAGKRKASPAMERLETSICKVLKKEESTEEVRYLFEILSPVCTNTCTNPSLFSVSLSTSHKDRTS